MEVQVVMVQFEDADFAVYTGKICRGIIELMASMDSFGAPQDER